MPAPEEQDTQLGPVCSYCGDWMLPYSEHDEAPLACVQCDLIEPVVIPPYAMRPAPELPDDDDEL